jgi:SOS response associated peptidase (SRAP)
MKIEILHPFGLSGSEIFSSIHPRKARLIAGMLSLVLESGRIPRRASSLGTSPADGEPMTFAGLWDEWKDKATGEVLKSCTMLITEPNGFVAEVHDRMPVVLESKDFVSWLNEGGLALAVTLPYVARELGKSVSFAEISKYVEQNADKLKGTARFAKIGRGFTAHTLE